MPLARVFVVRSRREIYKGRATQFGVAHSASASGRTDPTSRSPDAVFATQSDSPKPAQSNGGEVEALRWTAPHRADLSLATELRVKFGIGTRPCAMPQSMASVQNFDPANII